MIAPSGEQIEIVHGDQRAVAVEVGGGLREYTLDGRNVLDGYGADEMSSSGRGQVLIPWPNRIQDGRYSFDGQEHQLPLDDVAEQDAIHGLVRWGSWIAGDRAENRVVMEHALHPQPGYPFSLALSVEYLLSEEGLLVRTTATNRGQGPCPYGSGNHPYLTLGQHSVDPLTLRVPAPSYWSRTSAAFRLAARRSRARTTTSASRGRLAPPSWTMPTPSWGAELTAGLGSSCETRRGQRAHPLGRREAPVCDGVHGRSASGRGPTQRRGRADDLSTERVSLRRGLGPARARSLLHEQLGHRSAGASVAMIDIDSESFLAVVVAAALAAFVAGLVSTRMPLPVVVLEVVFGILIGPDVLGFAEPDEFLDFFSNLGLGMLFFFAGYEIDFERIRGDPLLLGVLGWVLSLVLAYSIGGLLTLDGPRAVAPVYGLGAGHHSHRHPDTGPERRRRAAHPLWHLSARRRRGGGVRPDPADHAGVLDEGAQPTRSILIAFVVVAVVAAVMAVRGVGRGWALLDRSLETSGQLTIRITVVLVFALGALASSLGLDVLLGGFVAGVIARLALRGREVKVLESKLIAVGYGFLIPFFFVVSGVKFDLAALTNDPIRLLELPLFLGLFLIVRGTPALVLYRGVLGLRDRAALAVFSATGLPLIVAITTIAVEEGHMRSITAASLVGAGILSTAILPIVGLRLRAGAPKDDDRVPAPDGRAAAAGA